MSNHLAIATVTATLGQIVHAAAQASGVGGVSLKFGRPTAPATATERKVHVYLYQVAPNAALRNSDTPMRDAEGRLARRPQAALDLFYLISFFGDADLLEPDRMLGATVRDLHTRPLLTGQAIADTVAGRAALAGSDLAASVERVKLTPIGMTLDEMSRLWSVMTQTPHALSVAYQVAVVLIEADVTPPVSAPVLRRGLADQGVQIALGAYPAISGIWLGTPQAFGRAIRPPSFPNARLGLRLAIRGSNLGGDALAGTVGWTAGVYSVSLVVTREGRPLASGAVPLALAPRITSISPSPATRDGAGAVSLNIADAPVVTDALVRLRMVDSATGGRAAASVDSMPFLYDDATGTFGFDAAQRITIT